jgi:hypothetical protein
MKRIFKSGLLALALGVGLTSCLKDQGYTDIVNAVGAEPIVSIFGGAAGSNTVISFQIGVTRKITYAVNLGSPEPLDRDVTVTVGASPDVLARLNAARQAAGQPVYTALPTTSYKINPSQVVIKAGQRDANFDLEVTLPANHDLTKAYVIPVGITDAGGAKISSNQGYFGVDVKPANIYEGTYRATGTFTHPTAGARAINQDKTLATIDATTVATDFADLGGSGWKMWLQVKPDNTVVLIPKESANTGTVQEGENRYDPATKTFILNYKYEGAGGFRVVTEKIAKK